LPFGGSSSGCRLIVPMAVDLVLATFKEEVADSCSTLYMRLDGGLGLLILTAAIMRSASSTNQVRAFTDRRRCCRRVGVVKASVGSGVLRRRSFFSPTSAKGGGGLCDGIPDSGVGGGWSVTGSSVLRLAASDLCSTPALRKMADNGRSSSKVRLGIASGR
jgi:hypothetical protein